MTETGYGIRLDTYYFEDAELPAAIDRLLADEGMRSTLAKEAARIQQESGVEKAARLIERVGFDQRS